MPKVKRTPLRLFEERWHDCTACDLYQCRKNIVLWRGTCPCDVLFIAEAPGVSEDILGQPMVGPAGHLLDHIINRSIPRDITYAITNLICCIPKVDGKKVNEPDDEFVEACKPRLQEFVELCKPELIIRVGKLAQDWLDPKYRHSIKFDKTIPMIDIVHPAAILRANVSQQGLAVQKSIVVIRNGIEEYLLDE